MSILESVILEMAIRRSEWISGVRSNLMGAFTEYLCGVIAVSIGEANHWEGEVKGLFVTIKYVLDRKVKFDKEEALKEAFVDALSTWRPLTRARNKVIGYYPKHRKQIIHHTPVNMVDELERMIARYMPEQLSTLQSILQRE